MSELSPVTEDRRPTVRIIACGANDGELKPILWGLEEEGIPAELESASCGDALTLAKQAAHMSKLNVGIAFNGVDGEIVLHHRDLAGECPLFKLATEDSSPAQLRLLGTNAARLVKGEPLVFRDQAAADDKLGRLNADVHSEELLDLTVLAVLELLAERQRPCRR